MRRIHMSALAAVLCSPVVESTDATANPLVEAAAKKTRKASVSGNDLIAALTEASARVNPDGTPNKPTAAELADELGMAKPSFDQRLNQLRMAWKGYGFIVAVKNGATAESLGMEQADFDKQLATVKENGDYDAIKADNEKVKGPFPWTLADGRSSGGNTGNGGSTRNAILAALMQV